MPKIPVFHNYQTTWAASERLVSEWEVHTKRSTLTRLARSHNSATVIRRFGSFVLISFATACTNSLTDYPPRQTLFPHNYVTQKQAGYPVRVLKKPFLCLTMPLFITSLNSGSNGNCYYVGNEREAVLIDAGISCRETERRMDRLGLSLQTVKAIFVSHEHSDHIRGVSQLAKKHQLPVYITPQTLQRSGLSEQRYSVRALRGYEPVWIGDLCITAFPKQHDACDPHSFLVASPTTTVGIFTDIGAPCEHVVHHFRQCHAAFLEANYDDDMLALGRYPAFLKQRIQSNEGHLSNQQALDLFREHRPAFMSHVLLSHLSKDNNSPQVVNDLFTAHAGQVEVVIASRFAETPVYRIEGSPISLETLST